MVRLLHLADVHLDTAFDLLADMAEERQVFFFTCHPHFAEEAAQHLDAQHLDLSTLREGGVRAEESAAEAVPS